MGAVIVTGGAGGLGTAIVADLRAAGRTVASFDRVSAPGSSVSFQLDVADESAVGARVAEVAERYGGIDALICAAGSVAESPVAEMPLDAWRRVIDASLTGTFVAARPKSSPAASSPFLRATRRAATATARTTRRPKRVSRR